MDALKGREPWRADPALLQRLINSEARGDRAKPIEAKRGIARIDARCERLFDGGGDPSHIKWMIFEAEVHRRLLCDGRFDEAPAAARDHKIRDSKQRTKIALRLDKEVWDPLEIGEMT